MENKDWNKVSRDVAVKELNKWLNVVDFEGDEFSEKDTSNVLAEMIIKSVCTGQITFDTDYRLIFNLKSPITDAKGNTLHTEITFKTEVLAHEYNENTRGIKSDDGDGRMLATICTFANMAKHKIDHLPLKEYTKLQAIASFLL